MCECRYMSRNRREILATLAASGALLAGCVSDSPAGSGDGTDNDDDGTRNGNADGDPPESKLPDEEFPEECPQYNVDRVICYDAVDPEELPGYLEPSTRTFTEADTVTFTLYNQSDAHLQSNFYNWELSKRVDGAWYRIAPFETPEPIMSLEAGESHEWSLTADNTGIADGQSVSGASGTSDLTVEGLGGGHYAFRATGFFDEEVYDGTFAFAATVELDADPIQLTTTDAIEETEWDGETLVAHSSRGDPDSDRGTLGAYELERLDSYNGDAGRIVTEQLLRNEQRRDVVALAETHDADRVRLEELNTTVPIFGSRSDGVFEYQDTYYEVSTEEIETE